MHFLLCSDRVPVKCGLRNAENHERVNVECCMWNDSAFYPLHIFRISQFETAGDLVGSLKLMFWHTDFQPSPITGFLLHKRKLQCTHESFFKYITSVIPVLDEATNMYMVTWRKSNKFANHNLLFEPEDIHVLEPYCSGNCTVTCYARTTFHSNHKAKLTC